MLVPADSSLMLINRISRNEETGQVNLLSKMLKCYHQGEDYLQIFQCASFLILSSSAEGFIISLRTVMEASR